MTSQFWNQTQKYYIYILCVYIYIYIYNFGTFQYFKVGDNLHILLKLKSVKINICVYGQNLCFFTVQLNYENI